MAEKEIKKKSTKKTEATPKATPKKSVTLVPKDLRGKDTPELAKELLTVRKDLADARRAHVAGELVNPRVIKNYRKDIARLMTIMVEKTRSAQGKEDV